MVRYKKYGIDTDSTCYIVGVVKEKLNKSGEKEEYIQSPKYYVTLESAVSGIMESERRKVTGECNDISQLLEEIKKSDEAVKTAFRF